MYSEGVAEPMPLVRLLSNENFPGILQTIESPAITFSMEKETRTVPREAFLSWGAPRSGKPATTMVLVDGSRIVGQILSIAPSGVRFQSLKKPGLWKDNQIPLKLVRTILFAPSWSAAEREAVEWKVLSQSQPREQLVLQSGDSLQGRLLQASLEKKSNGTEAFQFQFQLAGHDQPVIMPQDRIAVWELAAKEPKPSEEECLWIGFNDGSCVRTTSLHVENQALHLKLSCGAELVAQARDDAREPPENWTARVAYLQRESPKFVYAGDLTTLGFKHVPLFDWERSFCVNHLPQGTRFRVQGEVYCHGIYMPATSRLAYEIPHGMKSFMAEVACDDSATSVGEVLCRVFLEMKPGQWEPQVEQVAQRGLAPKKLHVALGTAQRIALVVERGAGNGDHALWLNARFIPE
jgi:NPCBM/NEW2 domain